MKKLFSMSEVGRLSLTAPHRIVYALNRGKIKEPRRLNGRRCFSEKDVETIKEYFNHKERGTTLP